jgi:hypothetical protein
MVGGRVVDADRSLLDQAQHLGGRHGLADAGDREGRGRRQGVPLGDPRRPGPVPRAPDDHRGRDAAELLHRLVDHPLQRGGDPLTERLVGERGEVPKRDGRGGRRARGRRACDHRRRGLRGGRAWLRRAGAPSDQNRHRRHEGPTRARSDGIPPSHPHHPAHPFLLGTSAMGCHRLGAAKPNARASDPSASATARSPPSLSFDEHPSGCLSVDTRHGRPDPGTRHIEGIVGRRRDWPRHPR